MSDPEGQRSPLGFFKIPDIENPTEEMINAVADAIYEQMIERSELRASTESDGRTARSRRTADENQHPDD